MALPRPGTRLLLAALAALLMAVPLTAARAAEPGAETAPVAFDYLANEGLSQPTDVEVLREGVTVPAHDGIELYIEVIRPKGDGPFPVILEASPYHGTLADRDGTRILPDPKDEEGKPLGLTGYFVPRGYAVVMMDLRGTGKSQGCLDHLGPNDANDLKTAVEWAADQPWSNGKVGMTGHSYVGGTQAVAAAQNPRGLATIVPSAGLASMYHHQFQGGVPYNLQWAGVQWSYEELAIARHLPPIGAGALGEQWGDNFGNDMEYFGCGLPQSSLVSGEAQLSGAYADWHAERDWTEGATNADIPVFMVHGVNDNAARVAAIDWFTARRAAGVGADDKLWLGQWDHGSGCCPNRRGMQWTLALHAWFDKWLAGRDVDTGPAQEIFMSDGTFEGARTGDRAEILLPGEQWPGTPEELVLRPVGDGTMDGGGGEPGEVSFAGDPAGFEDPTATGAAEFVTEPFNDDLVIAGVPELDLAVSVSTPRVHLITTIYDEDEEGGRRRITQFALNPELRDGLDSPSPASPGERYLLSMEGFAMGHHLRPGHKLVLRVTTSDPDKVPTFAIDPQITVFTGGDEGTALRLPYVPAPAVVKDDVPLFPGEDAADPEGPAQAPVSGTATAAAPGAGVARSDATSGYLEFEVEEGADNARLVVDATPSTPADIDLYLQQLLPDGSWSDDIAVGETSSTSSEQLAHDKRLEPGTYRVEAHNYAGAPGTSVELLITFFDRTGKAGTAA